MWSLTLCFNYFHKCSKRFTSEDWAGYSWSSMEFSLNHAIVHGTLSCCNLIPFVLVSPKFSNLQHQRKFEDLEAEDVKALQNSLQSLLKSSGLSKNLSINFLIINWQKNLNKFFFLLHNSSLSNFQPQLSIVIHLRPASRPIIMWSAVNCWMAYCTHRREHFSVWNRYL